MTSDSEVILKKNKTKNLIKCKKGQGLIEYLILVALIAVGTLGVVRVVGKNVATHYERINRALGAQTSGDLQIDNASQNALKKKDLSNFMDGAR